MAADDRLYISEQTTEVLLRASIRAGRHRRFAVAIVPDRGEAAGEHDLFRFALYYYAHALYTLARTAHSVRDLPAAIDTYVTADWDAAAFALGDVPGSLTAMVEEPVGEAHVLFRRIGYRNFDIAGEIPFGGVTLACSVLAVIQAVEQRVSPEVVDSIRAALVNMNVSYVMTHRYSDPLSCHEVPALAYRAAAFI